MGYATDKRNCSISHKVRKNETIFFEYLEAFFKYIKIILGIILRIIPFQGKCVCFSNRGRVTGL
jgi:hypothetical protein